MQSPNERVGRNLGLLEAVRSRKRFHNGELKNGNLPVAILLNKAPPCGCLLSALTATALLPRRVRVNPTTVRRKVRLITVSLLVSGVVGLPRGAAAGDWTIV